MATKERERGTRRHDTSLHPESGRGCAAGWTEAEAELVKNRGGWEGTGEYGGGGGGGGGVGVAGACIPRVRLRWILYNLLLREPCPLRTKSVVQLCTLNLTHPDRVGVALVVDRSTPSFMIAAKSSRNPHGKNHPAQYCRKSA